MKRNLFAIALAVTLASAVVWAADFWEKKGFTEWSDKEVTRMLTQSPWVRTVDLSFGPPSGTRGYGAGGGRGGYGGRGGGGGLGGPGGGVGVPQLDRGILACRGQTFAIGAKSHGISVAPVTSESLQLFSRTSVPEFRGPIGPRGSEKLADGVKRNSKDKPPMTFEDG